MTLDTAPARPTLATMRHRILIVLASVAALCAVAASPALADRRCDSEHPIYGLKTFGSGAAGRCGAALVAASRIADRYDRPRDFRGSRSTARISTRDAAGHTYSCKWQSASTRNDIINWACRSGSVTVAWVWRRYRLDA